MPSRERPHLCPHGRPQLGDALRPAPSSLGLKPPHTKALLSPFGLGWARGSPITSPALQ